MKKCNVFWYSPKYRPVDIATVPRGFVAAEWDYVNKNGYQFGAVAYISELPPAVIADYELELIEMPEELTVLTVYSN